MLPNTVLFFNLTWPLLNCKAYDRLQRSVTSNTAKHCSAGCIVRSYALKIHVGIQMFEPHSRIPGVISGLSTISLIWLEALTDLIFFTAYRVILPAKTGFPRQNTFSKSSSRNSSFEKLKQAWNEVARAASERARTSNLNQHWVAWPNQPSLNYGEKRDFQKVSKGLFIQKTV